MFTNIGRLRKKNISHREIETQRESSFKGSNPMEASTSRYGEIRLINAVVVATVQKKQLSNNNNNMSRSYYVMHAIIPPRVRWCDVNP